MNFLRLGYKYNLKGLKIFKKIFKQDEKVNSLEKKARKIELFYNEKFYNLWETVYR